MNPSSTLRVRRAVALAFFVWGAASIILSLALFGEGAGNYVSFPFVDTRLGGAAVVPRRQRLFHGILDGRRTGPSARRLR